MGLSKIHVWDDDIFEAKNGPTEVAYSTQFFGEPKLKAANGTIKFLVGDECKLVPHHERVAESTTLSGIVISGVDSMKSRKEIWEAVKANFLEVPLYIDGRSDGESFQIFTLSPSDFNAREIYESYMYDDSEIVNQTCGARSIAYISMLIGGIICSHISLWQREEPVEAVRIFQNLKEVKLS